MSECLAESEVPVRELESALTRAKELLAGRRFDEGMDLLYASLGDCRKSLDQASWFRCCENVRSNQSLMEVLLESPFTSRAFYKPRGYAGDAVLMDHIYEPVRTGASGISDIGRSILSWEYDAPGCKSVRARRQIIAQAIDYVSQRVERPNVLAVACGHLREAELSTSIQSARFGTFMAIDSDPESIEEVERCYQRFGIRAETFSVKGLIARRKDFEKCDLVYASGLYDYLNDRTARLLTSVLVSMLRPGGRLLVGNFAPEMRDIGYMEGIMDWRLIYRSNIRMAALVPTQRGVTARTWRDPYANIVFLDVSRS